MNTDQDYSLWILELVAGTTGDWDKGNYYFKDDGGYVAWEDIKKSIESQLGNRNIVSPVVRLLITRVGEKICHLIENDPVRVGDILIYSKNELNRITDYRFFSSGIDHLETLLILIQIDPKNAKVNIDLLLDIIEGMLNSNDSLLIHKLSGWLSSYFFGLDFSHNPHLESRRIITWSFLKLVEMISDILNSERIPYNDPIRIRMMRVFNQASISCIAYDKSVSFKLDYEEIPTH